MAFEILVNGASHRVETDPETSLLSVLRNQLGLTGSKYGCGEGQCGACAVLIDGRAVRSCITPVKHAAGRHVTTIEGLARNGKLHPVQQGFLDADALQCGYCTPGMVMSAVALLAKDPHPTDAAIRRGMEGNVCRCGTYPRIVAAVRMASKGAAR
ncbi:MAG: (2Fe-2S)-binding protein [Acidobacteria bacterium]|nr:(2Fe-2S)-binding protein [Acidobacteriota bacterium]